MNKLKRRVKSILTICAVLLLVSNNFTSKAQVASLGANSEQTYTLEDVIVSGAIYTDVQAVKVLADLPRGKEITFPSDRISRAIKNLWASRLFSDIQIYTVKTEGDKIWLGHRGERNA